MHVAMQNSNPSIVGMEFCPFSGDLAYLMIRARLICTIWVDRLDYGFMVAFIDREVRVLMSGVAFMIDRGVPLYVVEREGGSRGVSPLKLY